MDAKSSSSSKRRRRRWWPVALIIVLALLGWWRLSRPPEMRLVACIPLDHMLLDYRSGIDYFARTGLLLRLDRQAANRPAPGTLTAIGLDGKARWQASVPVVQSVPALQPVLHFIDNDGLGTVRLSPDGHVLAVFQEAQGQMRLWSWRDGKLLGAVSLPVVSILPKYFDVTNSGRVWLRCYSDKNGPYRFYAIDGSHIAFGTYHANTTALATYMRPGIEGYYLSPDGMELLCCGGSFYPYVDYCRVRVQGLRVIISRQYTAKTDGKTFMGWNEHYAILTSGLCFGPHGRDTRFNHLGAVDLRLVGNVLVQRKFLPNDSGYYRISPHIFGRPWTLRTLGNFCDCSEDGRMALCCEFSPLNLPFMSKVLVSLPARFQYLLLRKQLAVYTTPGHLRAVLHEHTKYNPVEINSAHYMTIFGQDCISPDNRYICVYAERIDGNSQAPDQCLLVYTWK